MRTGRCQGWPGGERTRVVPVPTAAALNWRSLVASPLSAKELRLSVKVLLVRVSAPAWVARVPLVGRVREVLIP